MLLAANLAGAAMVVIAVATSGQTLQPESVGRAVRRVALLLAGTYLLSPLLQVCAGLQMSPHTPSSC